MKSCLFGLLLLFLVVSPAFSFGVDDLQIHSFVSQGYLQSNTNNYFFAQTEDGTFEFNEFGFNVATRLSGKLHIGTQFIARDLGAFGNDAVNIDWAFLEYRHRNWLGVRVGKIKAAAALHNEIRDIDAARTFIFLPIGIYDELLRETITSIKGAGVFGLLPGRFSYQIQYGFLNFPLDGAVANVYSNFGVQTYQIQAKDSYIINLGWNAPIEGLRVGAIFARTEWLQQTDALGDINSSYERPVYYFEYFSDRFAVSAEYTPPELERTIGPETSVNKSELYYGAVSVRVSDWLEVGGFYSVENDDRTDRDGDRFVEMGQPRELAWMKDIVISTRIDLTENFILKLEGHRLDGLINTEFDSQDPDEIGYMFATKLTTYF